MKTEQENIRIDNRNYRKHGDTNKKMIRQSIKECGAGRSIVVDNENVIIAGNGVYEQATALGLKVRIIESDGSEIIAIKRTDLSTTDERRKLLAMADNRTSDTSEFDFDLLAEDFDIDLLGNDWDFDLADFGVKNNPNDEFDMFGEFKYVNKDCSAYRQIIINFESEDDVKHFAELTNLPIRYKTKSIYFPYQEKEKMKDVYE
ncbi:MAG: hypothetical protein LBP85_10475 [Prevotellaceae bacterium]|jgi:hypothetical protein|nr:hypothetical protein [Prevotellaceae bacterium]